MSRILKNIIFFNYFNTKELNQTNQYVNFILQDLAVINWKTIIIECMRNYNLIRHDYGCNMLVCKCGCFFYI